MSEFQVVFGAVVPVFIIIALGFILRRLRWLTAEADQSLLRLTINLLLPCLILDAAVGNPALARWGNLVLAPLVGAGTFGLGMLGARWGASLAGLADARARRTFTVAVGLYNYGFVPIPLALLLFGEETVGVLFVHNMGVELALWTAGIMVMSGRRSGAGWSRVLNAPLISMVLALLLNLWIGRGSIPNVLLTTVHILAQCAIPLSLVLAGATIDDHLEEFHSRVAWRVIAIAAALRLALLPACFLLLAALLPATKDLKRVMVLQAAMPSAVFPIVMAKHYDGDPPTALRVVLGTSILSLVTIPFWIRFGLGWLGL